MKQRYDRVMNPLTVVVDRWDFWQKCEAFIWTAHPQEVETDAFEVHTFGPLYDTVVALGAITTSEDEPLFGLVEHRRRESSSHGVSNATYGHTLAMKYFVRAKRRLGDIFETCSLDGTLTLFLLSVLCQNLLQQHSCYMYAGMAVRAAIAMGIPMTASSSDALASRLWWALYSFEIEMSMSAGRASALAEPACYSVVVPHTSEPRPDCFISHMVPFAAILNDICRKIYSADASVGHDQKSRVCLEIDEQLQKWKSELDTAWDGHSSSLTEPEWKTKQKLVCNLRFWNARILLHRPFLVHLTASPRHHVDRSHIVSCVEAAQATIATLYDAFTYRPFFRSWWYNSTYVLYAAMISLYLLLSGAHDLDENQLLRDGQRGLEIPEAMQSNVVAARCAAVIREIIDTTEAVMAQRRQSGPGAPVAGLQLQLDGDDGGAAAFGAWPDPFSWDVGTPSGGFDGQPALWNMVDPALFDNLLDVELARLQ